MMGWASDWRRMFSQPMVAAYLRASRIASASVIAALWALQGWQPTARVVLSMEVKMKPIHAGRSEETKEASHCKKQ